MRTPRAISRSVLLALAILYAAATTVYSASWSYYIRAEQPAELGIEFQRSELRQQTLVSGVVRDSPAQRAGFKIGDDILAINHRRLATLNPLYDSVSRGRPGDRVTFTVKRPGVPAPITLSATLAPVPPPPRLPATKQLAIQLLFSYQVPFVVVGLAVLFLRLESLEAWLLALMFGGFIAGSPLLIGEPLTHPGLRGFAFAYMVAARGMFPPLLYYFFATFPVSSPIDRRVPWLKSLALVAAAVIVIPLSLWTLIDGGSRPLLLAREKLHSNLIAAAFVLHFYGITGLGLISLVTNSLSTPDRGARRKIRVILWGMVCGLSPFLAMSAVSVYRHTEYWNFPFWIWVPTALSLCLVPLAFAYAVVKHRVLEIPVLLKRSARYVLVQRGFIVLLVITAAGMIALFTRIFAQFFPPHSNLGMALSAAFGIVLVWASAPVVKRGTQRIDHAFFRSAYDARQILENLVERTRVVTNPEQLATLLAGEIGQALHPTSMAVYLGDRDGGLRLHHAAGDTKPESLPVQLPLLKHLARERKPWDISQVDGSSGIASDDLSVFAPAQPECLVPMLKRDGNLSGLIVLGPRLSEEPYSREDIRLLASVAGQAGIALETMRLAEEMAERIQAERRAAQEMAIATQVQARLFPQKFPPLTTLEYAGRCIQARQVGGDYYDFLNLGVGRLGIVLADVAGKGISGALLMANLQATLRGQYAVALEDLPQLLKSVNQLFYENTGDSSYATLFFGDYQDRTRRLRYANCGHNPPILLRSGGSIERLNSTTTVLGLFEEWECPVCEVQIAPGDILLIYTDGITEAMTEEGEELGEDRLVDVIRNKSSASVLSIVDAILSTVQKFSGREQADDLTLVVARGD